MINMRILFFLLVFTQTYAQHFHGHVADRRDASNFPGVIVEITQHGKFVERTQTDFDGNFILKNLSFGDYTIKLSFVGTKSLIQDINFNSDKLFTFVFPEPCEPSKKICPRNHTDDIIPIVYGLPGKKLLKAEKKGFVKLGGCEISDCNPLWFCKKHKLSF